MKAVVFDLDGTLIDSAPDLHAAANTVLAAEGAGEITLDQARSFIGNGAAVFVQRMRAAAGLGDDARQEARMVERFMELYETAVHRTVLYPGLPDALDALRSDGWRLGICTNKPVSPTRSVLRHLGVLDRFEAIIGGDSLPVNKPDPAPLRAAVAALGSHPCVYVGDSEVDAETAKRAAIPFALFTEGYRKSPLEALPHAASFSDFAQLPDIAGRLLSETCA